MAFCHFTAGFVVRSEFKLDSWKEHERNFKSHPRVGAQAAVQAYKDLAGCWRLMDLMPCTHFKSPTSHIFSVVGYSRGAIGDTVLRHFHIHVLKKLQVGTPTASMFEPSEIFYQPQQNAQL